MSFKTRLAPHSKVILIMTRWHEDDLAGRLLENEEHIKLLRFPCECEEENDLLHRRIGDALCPEIGKDNEWLKVYKNSMVTTEGTMAWNAMFQGRPSAMEGNIIQRDWWEYYEELPQINTWVMSVDASFKDDDQSDYVAIQVWGKNGPDIYLIDAVKKHLNFPDTIMEIRRLRAMYPDCKTTLIEDRANGSAIITMLRREMSGIIAVQPIGSKMARVQAVLGAIESGNVHVPKNRRFTADFVDECSSFPNAAHDDQVDCMSQALNRLIYQRGNAPIIEKLSSFDKMFPQWRANRVKGHGKIKVV
jgi:predicted phage terminase large subunit-like protein